MSVAAASAACTFLGTPAASAAGAAGAAGAKSARPAHKPAARTRRVSEYTYKLYVTGNGPDGSLVHAVCSGSEAVIPGTVLYPLSLNTGPFFVNPRVNVYDEPFNVHLGANTKLTVTGPYASEVRNVCAMNEAFGPEGNGYAWPGIFTWRLPAPARSLAELVSHPAAEAVMLTGE
ncbi:MAG: hypothetical protein ACLP1Q_20350 [Solirubrobacteraceae bacterium]